MGRRRKNLQSGALDITAGPLIRLWRGAAERGRTPSAAEIESARGLVDMHDLELDSTRRVRLQRSGPRLDFGAIGKGFAADRGIEIYRQHGIRHAILDFGGNVAVVGSRLAGTAWRVGIQQPRSSATNMSGTSLRAIAR
jgi:thiamine biosynthesis lipoprotein